MTAYIWRETNIVSWLPPLVSPQLSFPSKGQGNNLSWGQWLFLLGETENFQMFKLDLEKAEEPEINNPSVGSLKKQESSRKTSTSALLNMPKPLTVWITTNCGKFWERWESQTTCLLRNLCAGQEATIRAGHATHRFQIGKGVPQGCILSPCLFNLYAECTMQNAGWMKHKLESKLPGERSVTSDMQNHEP